MNPATKAKLITAITILMQNQEEVARGGKVGGGCKICGSHSKNETGERDGPIW